MRNRVNCSSRWNMSTVNVWRTSSAAGLHCRWRAASSSFRICATAWRYAHRMGVVHTDIQPGQLFVTSDGTLKIPLLGPARLATQSTSAESTNAGLMIGTPQYMSPEQISGREIDHRTDVFSVGLILYETVTYSRAFPGAMPGIFIKIITEQPRSASQLNPSVDSALEGVIAKALQKTPADRYQTMSELAKDLARIRLRRAIR